MVRRERIQEFKRHLLRTFDQPSADLVQLLTRRMRVVSETGEAEADALASGVREALHELADEARAWELPKGLGGGPPTSFGRSGEGRWLESDEDPPFPEYFLG